MTDEERRAKRVQDAAIGYELDGNRHNCTKNKRGDSTCPLHVSCDKGCQALRDPVTLDEFRAALEHWEHHSHVGGCAHGY